jgi:poly(A) polymerase
MSQADLQALREKPGVGRLLDVLGEGQARFVGGAVRDTLLGTRVQDIDLATVHSPFEVMRRLGAAGIRTVPTGLAHGTVTALAEGSSVEVTSLRTDVATDGRHATVAFTDDWMADSQRRDFTVNALYFDAFVGELFDYHGGVADLEAGRVRFIGDPLVRIAEDHLRILRFFRFHARFGRGEPAAAGLAACAERANDLMALSRERIADELLKLLALADPAPTLAVMLANRILEPVLLEIVAGSLPRLIALIAAEREAALEADPIRRLAALLPADSLLAEKIAVRLKLSNRQRKRIASAAGTELGARPEGLAYAIGIESAQDRLLLAGRPGDAASLADLAVPRLPLGGGTLIKRGLAPGPEVARTLRAIESEWVRQGFPDDEQLETIVAAALATDQRR